MGGGSSKGQKTEVITAKSAAPGPQSGPNRGSVKKEGPSSRPVIESEPVI